MALQTLAARTVRMPLWVVFLSLTVAACTTRTPLRFEDADQLRATIAAGDKVRIETRDGRHIESTVSAVTDDAVVGADQTIAFGDIVTIEKIQLSKTKTAWASAGTIVILAAIGFAIALVVLLSQIDYHSD